MTFDKVQNWLFSKDRNRTSNIAEVKNTALKLGLIPLKFKAVHIAGTNGKGTTAALLAEILTEAGFKTGLFTSPHIISPLERIKINNKDIDEKSFANAVNVIRENQTADLNFFEVLTLASLYYFKLKKIDFCVIECGIGGLLDSTNIINPALSIITSVDLDHCALLGTTIKDIAWQKAGIIKSGIPVIAGRLSKEAFDIVKDKAKLEKSTLYKARKTVNLKQDFKKIRSSFYFNNHKFTTLLMGAAQNQNAAIAISGALSLGIDIKICQKVCHHFKIPCRFEVIKLKNGKFLIKDGAHNPAALKEFLRTYKKSLFYKRDNTLVFAASAGHDYKTLCAMLRPHFKSIIVMCPDASHNINPALVSELFFDRKVTIIRDIAELEPDMLSGNIIACGSFYLCALL